MGRMSAPVVTAAGTTQVAPVAPVVPYDPYAMGYAHHGPGFGGFLFLLFGAGLIFFVVTRFVRMARWHAWATHGGPPWMQPGMQPGASQGQWHQGPPWMRGGMGWGCGQQGQQPPTQAEAPGTAPAEQKPVEPKPIDPSAER
jgi:hypothetical protein